MSLRQEIETWVSALAHYDRQEYDGALLAFKDIADTSKILFNCGIIYASLGEHGQAVECFQRAVQLDQYMAISYFQQGVSNFLLGDFKEALANFNDSLLYLRGNRFIDYTQLGLPYKLHSCEALFNRGLCYFQLQQDHASYQDLLFASREKAVPEHAVIDEAIHETARGFTVFSVPVGIVFRPNEAKVRNLQARDYLGRARLIAQHQREQQQRQIEATVGSDGRRQLSLQDLSLDDRRHDMSYAAMNLVKPGLTSRSRQHSEPPLKRAVFPPTPPPEPEQPMWKESPPKARLGSRRTESPSSARLSHPRKPSVPDTPVSPDGDSVAQDSIQTEQRRHESRERHSDRDRSQSRQRPGRLDLGVAAFDHATTQPRQDSQRDADPRRLPRLRTGSQRSASEKPPPSLRRQRLDSAVEAHSAASDKGNHWRPVAPRDSRPHHNQSQSSSTSLLYQLPLHAVTPTEGAAQAESPQSWTMTPLSRRRAPSSVDSGPSPTKSERHRGRGRPTSPQSDKPEAKADGRHSAAASITAEELSSSSSSAYCTTPRGLHFELLTPARPPPPATEQQPVTAAAPPAVPSRSRSRPKAAMPTREQSRSRSRHHRPQPRPQTKPELRRLRLKLHTTTSSDDATGGEAQREQGRELGTRIVMVDATQSFAEVAAAIRAKLGWQGGECKVRMRDDEGDHITLGDDEDWAMAVEICRGMLAEVVQWRDGGEEEVLGKLDLWVALGR